MRKPPEPSTEVFQSAQLSNLCYPLPQNWSSHSPQKRSPRHSAPNYPTTGDHWRPPHIHLASTPCPRAHLPSPASAACVTGPSRRAERDARVPSSPPRPPSAGSPSPYVSAVKVTARNSGGRDVAGRAELRRRGVSQGPAPGPTALPAGVVPRLSRARSHYTYSRGSCIKGNCSPSEITVFFKILIEI